MDLTMIAVPIQYEQVRADRLNQLHTYCQTCQTCNWVPSVQNIQKQHIQVNVE